MTTTLVSRLRRIDWNVFSCEARADRPCGFSCPPGLSAEVVGKDRVRDPM